MACPRACRGEVLHGGAGMQVLCARCPAPGASSLRPARQRLRVLAPPARPARRTHTHVVAAAWLRPAPPVGGLNLLLDTSQSKGPPSLGEPGRRESLCGPVSGRAFGVTKQVSHAGRSRVDTSGEVLVPPNSWELSPPAPLT